MAEKVRAKKNFDGQILECEFTQTQWKSGFPTRAGWYLDSPGGQARRVDAKDLEIERLRKDNERLTSELEAKGKDQTAPPEDLYPPPPAPVKTLEERAAAVGLVRDGRWKDDRFLEEIEKKEKERESKAD